MASNENESKYEPCTSWSGIMRKSDNSLIEVDPKMLFGTSSWRICVINNEYAVGRQASEPIMYVKGDFNNIIYGQAHIVRADNGLLTAYHLNSELLLPYFEKYQSDDTNEPRNGFFSIKHKEYLPGGMSLESLKPLMTQQQWQQRDPMAIFNVKNETQKHLLKRKNEQLLQYQTKEAEQVIMELERHKEDSFEHIRRALIQSLFNAKLFYRARKKQVNNNGHIYITIDPKIWHEKLKPIVLHCGGYQVCFTANKESWKAVKLNADQLAGILNNGVSLTVTDSNGHEYEPTDGELYYSIKNCRLVIKYMPQVINTGINGQRRKHQRK